MRNEFGTQLEELNRGLISMGALCERAIACAAKAMLGADASLAREAVETEREIDRREKDIENLCLRILLRQQPVARDLRTVSSALKMITDMERIGDQAADIAEIVLSGDVSGELCRVRVRDMAYAVIRMVTDSIDAFVNKDESAARAVIESDDVVDAHFTAVRNDIIELIACDPVHGAAAVDMLMIAKYLERIGDHAVNIAGWVIFAITGEHTGG